MYAIAEKDANVTAMSTDLTRMGNILLEADAPEGALEEFEQANQQDPRVLYLTALAYRGQGDSSRARVYSERAAKFNAIEFNYAFVRERSQRMLTDG